MHGIVFFSPLFQNIWLPKITVNFLGIIESIYVDSWRTSDSNEQAGVFFFFHRQQTPPLLDDVRLGDSSSFRLSAVPKPYLSILS